MFGIGRKIHIFQPEPAQSPAVVGYAIETLETSKTLHAEICHKTLFELIPEKASLQALK